MPMFRPYLLYDAISCVILLIVYLFTIRSSSIDTKMTCCTSSQNVFLVFFLLVVFMNEIIPFFLLMQRAYTKRAFCVTLSWATCLGLVYPLLYLTLAFVDLDYSNRSKAATWLETNYQIRRNYMYVVSGIFTALSIKNRYHLKLKPWGNVYIVTFWFVYIYVTILASLDNNVIAQLPLGVEYAFMSVLILYAVIRIPLFFIVLSKETNFWRGGGSSIDDSAIGEVQKLLDENRHIHIDYMKLEFQKKNENNKNSDDDSGDDDPKRTKTQNCRRLLGT
jgi:hypothetical protein